MGPLTAARSARIWAAGRWPGAWSSNGLIPRPISAPAWISSRRESATIVRAQRANRPAALVGRGAIEGENAVQMIDLVLHQARSEVRELEGAVAAVEVGALDLHGSGALDGHRDGVEAQAPLVERRALVRGAGDPRVHERVGGGVGVEPEHEDAAQEPDLRGREPGAAGLDEQPLHPG